MMTDITVILSAYNRPDRLLRAVASVEAQTIRDRIELIVADNGSPGEQQREILRGLERTGTKVLWGPVERPEERARYCVLSSMVNRALDVAQGKFVRYLLDSDEYTPGSCEALLDVLRPALSRMCVWGQVQYRRGGQIAPAEGNSCANRTGGFSNSDIVRLLESSNFINHNSAMHTATDLARWDTSPEAWKKSDWLFWRRLAREGYRFAAIDAVVETYDTDGRMGASREAAGKSVEESLRERFHA